MVERREAFKLMELRGEEEEWQIISYVLRKCKYFKILELCNIYIYSFSYQEAIYVAYKIY